MYDYLIFIVFCLLQSQGWRPPLYLIEVQKVRIRQAENRDMSSDSEDDYMPPRKKRAGTKTPGFQKLKEYRVRIINGDKNDSDKTLTIVNRHYYYHQKLVTAPNPKMHVQRHAFSGCTDDPTD